MTTADERIKAALDASDATDELNSRLAGSPGYRPVDFSMSPATAAAAVSSQDFAADRGSFEQMSYTEQLINSVEGGYHNAQKSRAVRNAFTAAGLAESGLSAFTEDIDAEDDYARQAVEQVLTKDTTVNRQFKQEQRERVAEEALKYQALTADDWKYRQASDFQDLAEETKDMGAVDTFIHGIGKIAKGNTLADILYLGGSSFGTMAEDITKGGIVNLLLTGASGGMGYVGRASTVARGVRAATLNAGRAMLGLRPAAKELVQAQRVLQGTIIGSGSWGVERGNWLSEHMKDMGFNAGNPDDYLRLSKDLALYDDFNHRSSVRGALVGGLDGVSGFAATLRLTPASDYLRYLRKAANGADPVQRAGRAVIARAAGNFENLMTQATMQGALGGAGEAFGALASGDKISWSDVLLEVIGEFTSAPSEVITQSATMAWDYRQETNRARDAVEFHNAAKKVTAAVEALSTQVQDKEALETWAARVGEGGENTEFTGFAQDFVDSGVAERVAEIDSGLADRMVEAAAEGKSLTISVADITKIATKDRELANEILRDTRVSVDAMTPREAEEFQKTGRQEFEAAFDRLLERSKATREQRAEAHQVAIGLRDQLVAANVRKDVADMQVKPMELWLANRARQLGRSPKSIAQMMNLRVENGRAVMNAGGIAQARPVTKKTFGEFVASKGQDGGRFVRPIRPNQERRRILSNLISRSDFDSAEVQFDGDLFRHAENRGHNMTEQDWIDAANLPQTFDRADAGSLGSRFPRVLLQRSRGDGTVIAAVYEVTYNPNRKDRSTKMRAVTAFVGSAEETAAWFERNEKGKTDLTPRASGAVSDLAHASPEGDTPRYDTGEMPIESSSVSNSISYRPDDGNSFNQSDLDERRMALLSPEKTQYLTETERELLAGKIADTDLLSQTLEKIKEAKAAYPESDGWEPLTVADVSVTGDGVEVKWASTPYSFDRDNAGKSISRKSAGYTSRVNALAGLLLEEVRDVYRRAKEGDKSAQEILKQAGWYRNMRSRLRAEFGGAGDLLADLLGSTSPNTPVRMNWDNAIDILGRLTRGEWDDMLPKWEAWDKQRQEAFKSLAEYVSERRREGDSQAAIKRQEEYKKRLAKVKSLKAPPPELLPRKVSGALYGFNSGNALRAILNHWREVRDANPILAIGRTAPKAITFSGNLIGYQTRATIDVWAARLLQRIAGRRRIPSRAETGVTGDLMSSGETTLQFGMGQDVFHEAADRIRKDPEFAGDERLTKMGDDDLQAVAWFIEKEIWEKKGWTSAEGAGGSFEYEADFAGNPDRGRISELRHILNSKNSSEEDRSRAKEELEKAKIRAGRWQAGLSLAQSQGTQDVDHVPTDNEQEQAQQRLRVAALESVNGKDILAFNANSTLGMYGGSGERSLNVEISSRANFLPTKLFREMIHIAAETRQDSCFLSRVLKEGEDVDPARHRPGVELYFRDAYEYGDKDLQKLFDELKRNGIDSYTLVTDARATTASRAGAMPKVMGVRWQFVPEFDERYGGKADGKRAWSELSEDEIRSIIEDKGDEFKRLADKCRDIVGVTSAKRYWYASTVVFSDEYGSILNDNVHPAGAQQAELSTVPGERRGSEQPSDGQPASGDRAAGEAGVSGQALGQQGSGGPAALGVPDAKSLQVDIHAGRSIHEGVANAKRYVDAGAKPAPAIPGKLTLRQPASQNQQTGFAQSAAEQLSLEEQVRKVLSDPTLSPADRLALEDQARRLGVKLPYEKEASKLINDWDEPPSPGYVTASFLHIKMDDIARSGDPRRVAVVADLEKWMIDPYAEDEVNGSEGSFTQDALADGIYELQGEYESALDAAGSPAEKAEIRAKLETLEQIRKDVESGELSPKTLAEGPVLQEPEDGMAQPGEFTQSEQNGVRGSYQPSNTADANRGMAGIISLMENADKSTFLHESAHSWLDADTMLAAQIADKADRGETLTQGEREFLRNLGGFFKWGQDEGVISLGVTDDPATVLAAARQWGQLTTAQQRGMHELFAEGFESYLATGRAPSPEMVDCFHRFAEWLKQIYAQVARKPHPISKEVQALYDCLFVSEQEASEAEVRAGISPMFGETDTTAMTPEELAQYRALQDQARREALGIVQKAVYGVMKLYRNIRGRELRRLRREHSDAITERIAELEKEPRYIAHALMSKGYKTADGRIASMKLSEFSLREHGYDEETIEALFRRGYVVDPRGSRNANPADPMVTNPNMMHLNGATIEEVAAMAGTDDYDGLVRDLIDLHDIRSEAESQIAGEYAEMTGETPEQYSQLEADIAAHNATRSRMLTAEYNAIARMLGKSQLLAQAAKEYAAKKMGAMKLSDINPQTFIRDEKKCARAAEKAYRAGDFKKCLDMKRLQILNHVMAARALEIQKSIQTTQRRARRVVRNKGTLYRDFLKLYARIADRAGFITLSDSVKEKLRLADFTAEDEAEAIRDLEEGGTPIDGLAEAMNADVTEMTVDEAEDFCGTLNQLETIARNRLRQNLLRERNRIDEIIREGNANLGQAAAEQGRNKDYHQEVPKTTREKALDGLQRFFYGHIKIATWCRIFDRNKENGFFWNLFIRSANQRAAFEQTQRSACAAQLRDILEPLMKGRKLFSDGKVLIGRRRMSIGERLAAALNLGNESNRQRLVDGEPNQWTEEAISELIASLTKEEWQAVQKIWDLFESFRPMIAEKEKRVFGEAPKWIEAMPFTAQASDGEVQLRGGYYPVVFDPVASTRAEKDSAATAAKQELQGAYQSATTRRSFTKSRAKQVLGRKLRLDLSALYTGLNDVIHDLAWHEWLIETKKVLDGPGRDGEMGLRQTIKEYYGHNVAKTFEDWRKDIAQGDRLAGDSDAAKVSKWAAGNVGVAAMGFSATSAMVQLTGAGYIVPRAGAKATLKAMKRVLQNPRKLREEINAKSEFMRNRSRTINKQIADVKDKLETGHENWLKRYAYSMLIACQNLVDTLCWEAMYEKSMADGVAWDADNVAIADQAVIDTQSSGETHNMAKFERDDSLDVFTVFYSWCNAALNMSYSIHRGEADRGKRLASLMWMGCVMPVIEETFRGMLKGKDDDDDDDDWFKTLVRKPAGDILEYHLGLLLVTRELSNTASAAVRGEPSFSYGGPAGVRGIQTASKLPAAIADPFKWSSFNTFIDFAGFFRVPSSQVKKTVKGIRAIESGQAEGIDAIKAPIFGFEGRVQE